MIIGKVNIKEFFDAKYYRKENPDVSGSDGQLLKHYLKIGWREGRNPSAKFSTNSYLIDNPDVKKAGINPLLHYVKYGREEQRTVRAPGGFLGDGPIGRPAVQDALPSGDAAQISDAFDTEFYLASFPPSDRPTDPIGHYLKTGWREGRDPAPWFSSRHYLVDHPDVAAAKVNPFVHFCTRGKEEGRTIARLGHDEVKALIDHHTAAIAPGPDYEEFDPDIGTGETPRAKVLAYYLPQFHPTEVNDRNWGTGFSEWRNLPRGLPRFEGHVQPRLPRDLGFYDLRDETVMARQVALARAAGIHGFCFYYYWFDGRRVLHRPVDAFLDSELNFPFCLLWANENWTRTWDGSDDNVILAQTYSPDQDADLVADFARHMRDKRYIRIGERPLLILYRPGVIPSAPEAIARWRTLFREEHDIDPLIFMAQGFGDTDPRLFGLDGAIEFPPHKIAQGLAPINSWVKMFDRRFSGHVFRYTDMVENSLAEPPPPFPLIKTATPSWDNDARRPGRGAIYFGFSPGKFGDWMSELVTRARACPVHGEAIVAVNAWNEWAEGAVLEPDIHYGGAFLNALARAVHGRPKGDPSRRRRLVVVGHDANPNGAQMLAIAIGETLKTRFGIDVSFVLGEGGPLLERYRQIGPTHVTADGLDAMEPVAKRLWSSGHVGAITNTTPSGRAVPTLKRVGYRVISLIHELPRTLAGYDLGDAARAIATWSDGVIFPAEMVREGFEGFVGTKLERSEVFPQGLYLRDEPAETAQDLRVELGLPRTTRLVLGVGYADLRKGIDRFTAVALAVCARRSDVAFLWVGNLAEEAQRWFLPDIQASGAAKRILFPGQREDMARIYAASDLFYLSSREDPFPSVVLEAMAAGLPVIGHRGCSGTDKLIETHGSLLEDDGPQAAVEAILATLDQPPSKDKAAAQARRAEIAAHYDFEDYAFGLLQRLFENVQTVSVAVPNFNYEKHIAARLKSIFDQVYPIRELSVLDDASSDDSLAVIRRTLAKAGRHARLEVNERNTGSPFVQWRRAAERARGDYVWIAEADDLAQPMFLERLVTRMHSTGAVLGFCDSRIIDETGKPVGASYKSYLNEIEAGAFDHAFDLDGFDFAHRFLSIKNVILNVSGAVFRRDALLRALQAVGDEIMDYSVAGDWRLYLELCLDGGRVCYLPDVLNVHRRHSTSITHALEFSSHLGEIGRMHDLLHARLKLSDAKRAAQRAHLEACRRHLEKKRD